MTCCKDCNNARWAAADGKVACGLYSDLGFKEPQVLDPIGFRNVHGVYLGWASLESRPNGNQPTHFQRNCVVVDEDNWCPEFEERR